MIVGVEKVVGKKVVVKMIVEVLVEMPGKIVQNKKPREEKAAPPKRIGYVGI